MKRLATDRRKYNIIVQNSIKYLLPAVIMLQIKAFILSKYQEWQTTGYTLQRTQHREEFSRETQCNKLA